MMHLSVDNNAPFTFANMCYYYIKKYDQTHNYLILTSQKCHKCVSQMCITKEILLNKYFNSSYNRLLWFIDINYC